MQRNRSLAIATAALVPMTFALLVFGSTVRAHGAGLSCPDWPLCFGEVIPAFDFKVYLEFGHRVLASAVSFIYLGIGAVIWRRELPRGIKTNWIIGGVLLLTQVILGGLTVLELLAEWTVTSHLVCGNLFTLTLMVLALRIREVDVAVVREPVSRMVRGAALALAGFVLLQLVFGGLVSSSGAGLACGTWPGCNAALSSSGAGVLTTMFPSFEGLVGLQITHRIVAYTLFLVAAANLLTTGARGRVGRGAIAVFLLICMQIVLGISNVLTLIPVEVTVAHSAGAAAIVLATTWLNYEAFSAQLSQTAPQGTLAGVSQ